MLSAKRFLRVLRREPCAYASRPDRQHARVSFQSLSPFRISQAQPARTVQGS